MVRYIMRGGKRVRLRPLEEIIDPPDEYEEKLLKLLEKAYRDKDMGLYKKLASLYEEVISDYHMDFKKAYMKALKLISKKKSKQNNQL